MKENPAKRILIVDDDPLILYAISKAICRDGVEIDAVSTGEEATARINSCPYDLCFLDIYLPDLDGLSIMYRLKEISPETKVVIMTASYVDDDMKKTIDDSADYFIPKPFEIFQIRAITESALKGEAHY
ncbi:MAG: response regulator [Desulfatiglandales bacterium]